MSQVKDRIADFVQNYFKTDSKTAHEIRYKYWKSYGTTLGGLMAEHGVEPSEYLDYVHDVDLDLLKPCPRLRSAIEALPGRKLIFTNADAPYAHRVLEARGLKGVFEGMFDIHQMDHQPKPTPKSYERLCANFDINPSTALFIEDSAHNLEPAKALGMTTVWVNHANEERPAYVDHDITNLTEWLETAQLTLTE